MVNHISRINSPLSHIPACTCPDLPNILPFPHGKSLLKSPLYLFPSWKNISPNPSIFPDLKSPMYFTQSTPPRPYRVPLPS